MVKLKGLKIKKRAMNLAIAINCVPSDKPSKLCWLQIGKKLQYRNNLRFGVEKADLVEKLLLRLSEVENGVQAV